MEHYYAILLQLHIATGGLQLALNTYEYAKANSHAISVTTAFLNLGRMHMRYIIYHIRSPYLIEKKIDVISTISCAITTYPTFI